MGTVCFHSCLIHYSSGQTSPVEWALFGLYAIAAPGLVAVLAHLPTYTGIMSLDTSSHIGQATVADLYRVPIKHFM